MKKMTAMKWLYLFVALITVAATVQIVLHALLPPGELARVYQGERLVRVVDLSRVTSTEYLTVSDGAGGENVVLIERGRISVSAANCPDQICVRQGAITEPGVPIICLPHRVIVQIVPGGRGD